MCIYTYIMCIYTYIMCKYMYVMCINIYIYVYNVYIVCVRTCVCVCVCTYMCVFACARVHVVLLTWPTLLTLLAPWLVLLLVLLAEAARSVASFSLVVAECRPWQKFFRVSSTVIWYGKNSSTLQHTAATHCNPLQHTATPATHCNKHSQESALQWFDMVNWVASGLFASLQGVERVAVCCSVLQCGALCCSVLQFANL